METHDTNDNVLWLRILSKTNVLYVAVAYAPFDDGSEVHKQEATDVFNTLKLNIQELQTSGTVVLMGDLNARMPDITGDKGVTQNNKNGVMLKSLMKDSDLSACVNTTQQQEETHYTYLNHTADTVRKSIPDYILYPRSSISLCNNYRVHPNVSCDSMHRLLTVRVNFTTHKRDSIWDPNISKTAIWSIEDINTFKSIVDQELVLKPINNKGDIDNSVTHLNKILKKAFEKIMVTRTQQYRVQEEIEHEQIDLLKALSIKRGAHVSQIAKKYHRNVNNHWDVIKQINDDIHKITYAARLRENQRWWKHLSNILKKDDAINFWR